MVDNVVQHSANAQLEVARGLVAYDITRGAMRFAVSDVGRGVLESLRENPRWASLVDAAAALRAITWDHATVATCREPDGDGEVILLDFSGIESATSSYLKGSLFRLFELAGMHGAVREPDTPLNIYPVIFQLTPEVAEGICDLLLKERLVCLEALTIGDGEVRQAKLHGVLDPLLRRVLDRVTELRRATAGELHERFGRLEDRPITITAWNNRLNDLHAKRLLRRRRMGRQWIYEPVVGAIVHG